MNGEDMQQTAKESEPSLDVVRADLHDMVDNVEKDDLLVMFLGKHVDGGVQGNMRLSADAEGVGQVMEQLAIRLGYMLGGDEAEMSAKEAYCIGVGAFGGVAKHRMQEYADQVAEEKNAGGGTHVREDVTDGAGAVDTGSKGTH